MIFFIIYACEADISIGGYLFHKTKGGKDMNIQRLPVIFKFNKSSVPAITSA